MAKYIHNISGGVDYYLGVEVADTAFYLIPTAREADYAGNNSLLTKLVAGDAKMSADGSADIAGSGADQIRFLIGEQRVRTAAFSDDDGVSFNGCGMTGTITAGEDQSIDMVISTNNRFNGIDVLLYNQARGDVVGVQVVDVDNLLGYGAGTVLSTFAHDWFVDWENANQGIIQVPYFGRIVAGLYVRINYNSTGADDVSVYGNLFLHKEI